MQDSWLKGPGFNYQWHKRRTQLKKRPAKAKKVWLDSPDEVWLVGRVWYFVQKNFTALQSIKTIGLDFYLVLAKIFWAQTHLPIVLLRAAIERAQSIEGSKGQKHPKRLFRIWKALESSKLQRSKRFEKIFFSDKRRVRTRERKAEEGDEDDDGGEDGQKLSQTREAETRERIRWRETVRERERERERMTSVKERDSVCA